jgi:hypothetical protein
MGQGTEPLDMGQGTTQHWTVKEGEFLEGEILDLQEIPLP